MKWERAKDKRLCGSCRVEVKRGDPMLLITEADLVRCEACAKRVYRTQPPADLPALPEPEAPTQQPFAATRPKPAFDARMARTGEALDDLPPAMSDRVAAIAARKVIR